MPAGQSTDAESVNAVIIQVLREAKGQGLCSHIGLSANRSEAMAHLLRRVELDVYLSAGEYTLLDRRSPQTMLPVVREQGVAYVVGGIFKRSLGMSDDASPFHLAPQGPLASVGGVSQMSASSGWPRRPAFRSQH